MSRLIKILSIDGGGIRGIIPAMILAKIEQITSKPIAELFHLIAGTSTGGILALGLTKPNGGGKPEHPAANLVRLYEKEGSRIFLSLILLNSKFTRREISLRWDRKRFTRILWGNDDWRSADRNIDSQL
jgi:patatin-like phospholipase/acyl hydrolase